VRFLIFNILRLLWGSCWPDRSGCAQVTPHRTPFAGVIAISVRPQNYGTVRMARPALSRVEGTLLSDLAQNLP